MIYALSALVSILFSFFLSWFLIKKAQKFHLLDNPTIDAARRQHKNPTPLVGGLAIVATIVVVILYFIWQGDLLGEFLGGKQIIGLVVGLCILMLGGLYDDKYGLPVALKILLPISAASVAVASGIGVNFITNPLGGVVRLDQVKIMLFVWQGVPYYLNLYADLFTVIWLTMLIYATELLDGLDGLVTGVTFIGAMTLFFLSLSAPVLQFDTALLLVIVAGAFLGFLPFNWNPARAFLGNVGSASAGYILGIIAIIAGGKIATTALVFGLPIIDAFWVVFYRVFWLHRSPLVADRNHLHFRLLDAGFSVKQVVLMFYSATLALGLAAVTMQTTGKIVTLGLLIVISLAVIYFVHFVTSKNEINR